jgi:hypothetical protein
MRLYFIYYDSPSLYVRKRLLRSRSEHRESKKVIGKIRNFHKIYALASAVIGIGNKAQKIFEKIRFFFDFSACKDLFGGGRGKIKISFFLHAAASYDMNDKTSIFLCCLFLQLVCLSSREIHTYKKFICEMRQGIDGISARESSSGNRISCSKGWINFILNPLRSTSSPWQISAACLC